MINHEAIAEFSEMTARERQFVLECIEDKKPKKDSRNWCCRWSKQYAYFRFS